MSQHAKKAYSFGLESVNSLDVSTRVVSHGLEVGERLLGFVDDSLVLEDRTVVLKVDSGGLRMAGRVQALGFRVTLAERLEGGDGLCIMCYLP